jgi:type I restriction enzyme M protein|tara:strand:- start:1468 stop:3510 length:2043 start_codon:yes stop_codon:yes gene_type:complete
MTILDAIKKLFKTSNHSLSIFSESEINRLKDKVSLNKEHKPIIDCLIREKKIILKPEEVVRQLYTYRLINEYSYPIDRIKFEYSVSFGREKKKADIVVFNEENFNTPLIIIEVKKPKLKDGKDQLKSYCNATGATMGVWSNGEFINHFHRKDPNFFEEIPNIPNNSQNLEDVLSEKFTLRDLMIKDKITNEKKSLKEIIKELEDDVMANTGVDVFEEVFKLIFTKLYDEKLSIKDKNNIDFALDQKFKKKRTFSEIKKFLNELDNNFRPLEFRNSGQTDSDLRKKIQNLFDDAISNWTGIFNEGTKFELSDSHLAVCISSLQEVKLFNSNLIVVDEAFEYLTSKTAKSEKGQFFTPRHIIDMCVKILNPKKGEFMIDTAAGSCGFPVHSLFKMTGHLFSNEEISDEDKKYTSKVFGIEFDEKNVRIGRTLNVIAGDGETNVLYLNTLDYQRWVDRSEKDKKWINNYGKGFERLEKLRETKDSNKSFNFDLLMANPPFAGDIKESRILHNYDLSFNEKNKIYNSVSRDILFIERNLDFVKPGGRLALVLPQGRFNNITDDRIREFISEKCRILGVVGLHPFTFKPHTAPKTSVLFLQKWDDDICPKLENYPIFFAVSELCGKNTSGEYIFLKDENGEYKLDQNNHLIVKHDLHNHDGELPDGIAEKFENWAKKQKLSFWAD